MLSGRLLNGYYPTMAAKSSVVLVNESGKPGMLRIIGMHGQSSFNDEAKFKMEIDGVIVYDGSAWLFITNSQSTQFGISHGMPVGTDSVKKLVNIPFKDSMKITLSNPHASVMILSTLFMIDYVIDIP